MLSETELGKRRELYDPSLDKGHRLMIEGIDQKVLHSQFLGTLVPTLSPIPALCPSPFFPFIIARPLPPMRDLVKAIPSPGVGGLF